MRTLHTIQTDNQLSDRVKLAIVNWHISSTAYPARRIGKVEYKDDKIYIWMRQGNTWFRDVSWGIKSLAEFEKGWRMRKIPLSFFNEDMVYKGEE